MLKLPAFSLAKTFKKSKIKKIAVLTSGGDAPGMNAAIRAVVRTGIAHGVEVFGIQRGYAGLLEEQIHPMNPSSVANIIQRGGTILKTSRCPEFHEKATRKKAFEILKKFQIDGLVVIGGDGSFRGAGALHKEWKLPVVGIPGTIDLDVPYTDDTIGFDTAVNTGIELIDKIRDTASSHDRIFLVEVMGRHCGMIALHTGIGAGAESILVPEVKLPKEKAVDEICASIDRGIRRGKTSHIIVVAEGCSFGGVTKLAGMLEDRGYDPRIAILGHTQRGGSPSAHDRLLASTLGAVSVHALLSGVKEGMIGVQTDQVSLVSFKKINGRKPKFSEDYLKIAKTLAV
jgi:6-phosphofructokinase 1